MGRSPVNAGSVVEFFLLFLLSQTSTALTFHSPTSRILLCPALRDYGGQVAPAYRLSMPRLRAGKQVLRRKSKSLGLPMATLCCPLYQKNNGMTNHSALTWTVRWEA